MDLERRTLLKGGAAAATGAVLGGPFAGFAAAPASARPGPRPQALFPVPDARDGAVRLHLPRGFSYRSFHDTEFPVVLDDGTHLPGRHDGMGAFRDPDGGVVLVRNHELNNPDVSAGETYTSMGGAGAPEPYDAAARGGTTTVHVDHHGNVSRAYTSLNGTMMNCSGGVMPWGSWITCEETINGPDVGPDFTGASNEPLQKPHGYIFEVPSDGSASHTPITAAGRFAHEAVSFDPVGGALYLTEDNFGFASGFYRYTPGSLPMVSGSLDNNGSLEMLAVKGAPNLHLEGRQRPGRTYEVEWVPIAQPDFHGELANPMSNNDAICFVGNQGRELGAAYFSRLEGQVFEDGVVYFCSTQGGGKAEDGVEDPSGYGNGHGQVWGYDTRNQTLTLVYQSHSRERLDFPDNVTASPSGTLVVCEDNDDDNYLRGLSQRGRIWDICLNRLTSASGTPRYDDEFAGSTFSPDGQTLYVNIQASHGMTFAIWGPWRRIGV
ncbi:MAG TPA: alkaline phosphatase PhoX [Nocardioidaceae bacterium]|nr:alkaline phosphatase PhoX [Nocardioidaceae bacterium]